MTVWTSERIALLRQRATALRLELGEPNPPTDPQMLAEFARQWAAQQNQGLDAGPDPTYDPVHDPHRDPGLEVS